MAEEPWDEVFAGKPDLIASGRSDRAATLLKASRHHMNVLGAYLNGKAEIGRLPEPVQEILDALTLRLVSPPGARWNDLRRVLDGQPAIRPQDYDFQANVPRDSDHQYHGKRRRPYDGGPDGEDLRPNLRCPTCNSPQPSMHPSAGLGGEVTSLCPHPFHLPRVEGGGLLGDADGTTMAEWPQKEG